jgi:hypothetical protein
VEPDRHKINKRFRVHYGLGAVPADKVSPERTWLQGSVMHSEAVWGTVLSVNQELISDPSSHRKKVERFEGCQTRKGS